MKTLSVDRIRHLHDSLLSLNKGVVVLSAFDRDVQQALRELLDIKSGNKAKKQFAARPAPFKTGKATKAKVLAPLWSGDATGSLATPATQKVSLKGAGKFTATCPRCHTEVSDTKPFTKRACPSCGTERIPILLNSQ